ncbi:MAG: hypothetical protein ACKOQ3_06805 [Novosphingobium sp.]
MFGNDLRLAAIRDREAARISRWFRESEAGWLFYGADGTAWHITGDEARTWEDEAKAMLVRHLDWLKHVELRIAAGAVATTFVGAFALIDLPLVLRAAAAAAALVPATYFLRQLTGSAAYDRRLRQWRAALAERLAGSARGGVPGEVESHHRRYNLFHLVEGLCCAALLGHLLWRHGLDLGQFRLGAIDIGLIGASLAAHVAATRVDATHRRRKWLDCVQEERAEAFAPTLSRATRRARSILTSAPSGMR